MTDYPNPDPQQERQSHDRGQVEPQGRQDPLPVDGREDDAVQIFERDEETSRIGASFIWILLGLVILILLGYLAYQLLF